MFSLLNPTNWRGGRWRRSVFLLVRTLARANTYFVIFLVASLMTILGAALVWQFEQAPDGEPALRDFENSFVYMAQNVAGVGIGARNPLTRTSRYTVLFIATLAAGLRGVFVATVVSTFVNRFILEGRGLGEVKSKKHVLICGYNPQVRQLVQVLEREAFGAGAPVVLLAGVKENPLPDHPLSFISGDPSVGADLERAGVRNARAVVIVSDLSYGPHSDSTLDARAVLTALAVNAVNPEVHTVAEVRDPANRRHFENAHVEELIVSAEMSEGLLARAALNHGLGKVFSDLLRLDTPVEMYVLPRPPSLETKTFQLASAFVSQQHHGILIGVLEGDRPVLSPPPDYDLNQATGMIVIGLIGSNDRQKVRLKAKSEPALQEA